MKSRRLLRALSRDELVRMASDILDRLGEGDPSAGDASSRQVFGGRNRHVRRGVRGASLPDDLYGEELLPYLDELAGDFKSDGISFDSGGLSARFGTFSRDGDLSRAVGRQNGFSGGGSDQSPGNDLSVRDGLELRKKQVFPTEGDSSVSDGISDAEAVLSEAQDLGRSRLPERLSELFCRDARRYDGDFARY